MSRTVSKIITPTTAAARSEIQHGSMVGGQREGLDTLAAAINGAYETLRGCIVRDVDPVTAKLTSLNDIVHYYPKVLGFSELTDENLYVYLLCNRTNTAGSPSAKIRTRVIGSGGTSTDDSEVNAGSSTTGIELLLHCTIAAYDDQETVEIKVDLSALANATLSVYGVFVGYARAKSTLTIAPAGGGGYLSSGFVPLDIAESFAANRPLSVWTMYQLLTDLRYLRWRCAGQIVTWSADHAVTIVDGWTRIPKLRPAGVVTSRWTVYVTSATGQISIETWSGSATITVSGAGLYSADITHDTNDALPVEEAFVISGETATFDSLCGHWVEP